MKKILFLTLALLISYNSCYSSENSNKIKIKDYLNTPYIGIPYNEALERELPFLLILARPDNAFMLTKFFPIAETVYNDFKGEYNFCIINAKIKENEEIVNFFNPEKYPATYIIDTQERTYTYIDKKYYNKKDIKKILTKFKDKTLFY